MKFSWADYDNDDDKKNKINYSVIPRTTKFYTSKSNADITDKYSDKVKEFENPPKNPTPNQPQPPEKDECKWVTVQSKKRKLRFIIVLLVIPDLI